MTQLLFSGASVLLSGGSALTTQEVDDMGLLAVVSDSGSNKTASSTTLADVDAANFVLTFTAPASGNVVVVISGVVNVGAFTDTYSWGIRESTTNIVTAHTVIQGIGTAFYIQLACRWRVSGLTPGNSYTWKGAHSSSPTASHFSFVGGSDQPRLMEVYEAP